MELLIEDWLDYVVDNIPPEYTAKERREYFDGYLDMKIWDGRNVPKIIADGDTETFARVIKVLRA